MNATIYDVHSWPEMQGVINVGKNKIIKKGSLCKVMRTLYKIKSL